MKRTLVFATLMSLLLSGYSQNEDDMRHEALMQNSLQIIKESMLQLQETVNEATCCYYIEVQNEQRLPVQIVLDGNVVGVVNPYKSVEYKIPREHYGLLRVIRRDGAAKEYRVRYQSAGARLKLVL